MRRSFARLSVAICLVGVTWGLFGPAARAKETLAPDAQHMAYEGDVAGAIEVASQRLTEAPTPETGRLLQDLLLEVGRGAELEALCPESTPAALRRALAARGMAPKEAIAAFKELFDDESTAAIFRIDFARAYLRAEKLTTARGEIERYLKEHPQVPEAHVVLGNVHMAREKAGPAAAAYRAALVLHAGHPQASVGLAKALAAAKRADVGAVRAALDAGLAIYPGNASLRFALVAHMMAQGEGEAASEALASLLGDPVTSGKANVLLAELWRARADYTKADAAAKTALAHEGLVPALRARALRVRGFSKQKQGDLAGARGDYEAAIVLEPRSAQLYADLGFAHALDEELELATTFLKRALDYDDELLDAHLKYGVVMVLADEAKKAKKALGVVLKADKQHLAANRTMGYLLVKEGKPKNALKHFTLVSELDPEDASALRMVGRCYLAMGKLDEALASHQEAVGRDEKDAFAHFDLGKVLERKESWDDAAASYRKAIELDPELAHPHIYLAELLDLIKDEAEAALPHYQRFLELEGDDESGEIAKRIEQIQDA